MTLIRAEGESDDDYAVRWETRRQSWVRSSGLPTGLLRTIDLGELPANVRAAGERWVRGDTAGLLLTGDVGVGKTTLAASLFAYRLGYEPGHWRTLPGLLDSLLAPFESPERTAAQEVVAGRRMLALDDLDKSRRSDWAVERVFGVIDAVVANGCRLLVTSNESVGQLAARWGEPVASRLRGHCEVVRISGPDRRLG